MTDLLRFRASVNTADVEGETALMEVTMLGDVEVFRCEVEPMISAEFLRSCVVDR